MDAVSEADAARMLAKSKRELRVIKSLPRMVQKLKGNSMLLRITYIVLHLDVRTWLPPSTSGIRTIWLGKLPMRKQW